MIRRADTAIPLNHLTVGEFAYVRRIVGQPDHVHRLEELGFRDGTRVEMFRSGSPCIVRLGGNKVCIRADHLINVLVDPHGSSAP